MSTKASVDVPELIKRILSEACPACREKILALEIPMTQVMTVEDLVGKK